MRQEISLTVCVLVLIPLVAAAQEWTEHSVCSDRIIWDAYGRDMDGDGDLDILAQTNNLVWWENADGIGNNWFEHVCHSSTGPADIYPADLDGDPQSDLDIARAAGNSLSWYDNPAWTYHSINVNYFDSYAMYAADIDEDGDPDLITASNGPSGRIDWYENADPGDGTNWVVHFLSGYNNWTSTHAADINGDGNIDILATEENRSEIVWWDNASGTGLGMAMHTITGSFAGVQQAIAADIDGDDDLDVVGAASTNGLVNWWENEDGLGLVWQVHAVDLLFDGAIDVRSADLDGDGDRDIVAAASEADSIVWYENMFGDGSAWLVHTIADAFDGARTLDIGDVNGDGNPDIIGGASDANQVSWWENPGSPAPPDLVVSIEPLDPDLVIPPSGATYGYHVEATNNTGSGFFKDVWVTIYHQPTGNTIQVRLWESIGFPADVTVGTDLPQQVPGIAPPGDYTQSLFLGSHPWVVDAWDSFDFTKLPEPGAQIDFSVFEQPDLWATSKTLFTHDVAVAGAGPVADYAISDIYPNPFNPTTSLTVELPETANLSVLVYNISGQRVATLANGLHESGSHTFTFDASNQASGLYFVRASVPGQLDEVQKVMLVR